MPGDCSGDRLRPAPLRDAHDVARSHRSRRMRDDALRIEDDALGYPWLRWARRQARARRRAVPGSDLGARRPSRTHPRRVARRVELRRTASARLLGRVRARRAARPRWVSTRRWCSRTSGSLWERTLDADLAVAHRQHDRVEPLVRVRSRPTARGRVHPGRAPDAARRATGSRGELARLDARRRAARDGRARRSSTAVRCRTPTTTRSGVRSSSTA